MESVRRKRKGLECNESLTPLTIIHSHLSMGDYSKQKKKCKEDESKDVVGPCRSVVKAIITGLPCRIASLDLPCRGLKRKIGCIDAATKLGRKKKIEQEYDLGATIGQGKFGSVVLCRNKATGEEFACKTLSKGEELVHHEVEIMQHLSGYPGIVTLKAVYEDLESFYLVMELCSGGRLLDQMAREGQYSEYRASNVLRELVSVIKYVHDMGVVHRDIKPENVLLTTSGQIKLSDFGLAVRLSNGQSLKGVVGSPAYVAPEVLAGDYAEKVDIWSAGVLLHTLLFGVLPFQGDSLNGIFKAIKEANLNFSCGLWALVSQPAQDLVAHMLTRDVSARLTADEVLRHPWILSSKDPGLRTLTLKPGFGNHVRLISKQLTVSPGMESERSMIKATSFLSDDSSSLILSCGGSTARLEDQDCGLVDALTEAISRVRISEPKRSRPCGPPSPVRQECSSNLKFNNQCTAF